MGRRKHVVKPPSHNKEMDYRFIRKCIKEDGLTQKALAHAMGCSASYLTKLLQGKVQSPDATILDALSESLHLPLEDLYLVTTRPLTSFTPSDLLRLLYQCQLEGSLREEDVPRTFMQLIRINGYTIEIDVETIFNWCVEHDLEFLSSTRDSVDRYVESIAVTAPV